MAGLFLIAHAPLASALQSVALHAFGDASGQVSALDVDPVMPPEEIERLALECLARVRDPQALILSDVFGATPFNVAQRLSDGQQVKVIAGVNVPMLWRALTYRHCPLDQLVERALSGATQGVIVGAGSRPQNQAVVRSSDDQAHHHHQ